jgi:hypothetical protein
VAFLLNAVMATEAGEIYKYRVTTPNTERISVLVEAGSSCSQSAATPGELVDQESRRHPTSKTVIGG